MTKDRRRSATKALNIPMILIEYENRLLDRCHLFRWEMLNFICAMIVVKLIIVDPPMTHFEFVRLPTFVNCLRQALRLALASPVSTTKLLTSRRSFEILLCDKTPKHHV